jgi:hypothetical protein
LHEFANKFPPQKYAEEQIAAQNDLKEEENKQSMDVQSLDQPVEKKMKTN